MSKSALIGALSEHMPMGECVMAMYVLPGTLAAASLLREAERKLAAARQVHEAATLHRAATKTAGRSE